MAKKYALVIAINQYKDSEEISELKYAYNDGILIYSYLLTAGYETVPLYGSEATYDAITSNLRTIKDKLQKGDSFIFYFSGHGFQTKEEQLVLSYDAQPWIMENGASGNAISVEFIEKATSIDGVERSFIIDACRKPLQEDKGGSDTVDGFNEKAISGIAHPSSGNAPISIMCSCGPRERSYEFASIKGGVFSRALITVFNELIAAGREISLIGVLEQVQLEMTELLKKHSNRNLVQTPFISGSRVVIFPGVTIVSRAKPSGLTERQTEKKFEADQLLDQVLQDHALWLIDDLNTSDERRLTWEKLKPVYAMYDQFGLGDPDLAGRDMRRADFSNVDFPREINFSNALLMQSTFKSSTMIEPDFTKSELAKCEFSSTKIVGGTFVNASGLSCMFLDSRIWGCNFDQSDFVGTTFSCSDLNQSSFRYAKLFGTDFSNCLATDVDFTDAKLIGAVMNQVNLAGSILTGAYLYGTARDGWTIDGVKCKYVRWKRFSDERFPPEQDFEDNEFTIQYKPYEEFSYTFRDGFTPFDLALATHIVDQINALNHGFEIRIDNASVRGLNPTINFIMVEGKNKRGEAQELFSEKFGKVANRLENKVSDLKARLGTQDEEGDALLDQLDSLSKALSKFESGSFENANLNQLLALIIALITRILADPDDEGE